ncbi:FMN-binding negative transcriptional regulator [Nocardia sp. NPDC050712]|uniref:FMN-binding negative transcriptional regulator n=1 Tax=Nocardia sp. NPDC050712 TaxID=3155518 RepID=UPI0033F51DB1
MYVPKAFTVADDEVRELLIQHGAANLITQTADGLLATLLPFVYDPETNVLRGHLARNNPQWRAPALGESLAIISGPDAYISPSAYASKREHGRVVPTWNYVTAHVYGHLRIHDDPAWLAALLRRLTDKHEAAFPEPWSIDDTPEGFVAGQLRAIVGVELTITRVEAKAKLSQNRPAADIDGVIESLTARGEFASAEAVRAARPSTEPGPHS